MILEVLFSHCCSCDGVLFHRWPAWCFGRHRIRSMCAVSWNDRCGQSLCLSVNADALTIVRVLVLAQPRFAISHPAKRVLIVSGVLSVPQWLMSQGYCFVIGSVSRCGFVTRCSASTTFEDVGVCLDFTLNSEHVGSLRRVHGALFIRIVRETLFNCSPKRCQNLFSHHNSPSTSAF